MLAFIAILVDDVRLLVESQPPFEWNRLGQHLPYEWVEHAVRASGSASIRGRRLLARQMVWLVIALALYRHQSISEVADAFEPARPPPEASFVRKRQRRHRQGRQRTGAAPLAWLFHDSASNWALQSQAQHLIKGLALLAMDGTTLRTAGSAPNCGHFGGSMSTRGRIASYPQPGAVALTAIPSHLVCDAGFGPYDHMPLLRRKAGLLVQVIR
jgi:hypothetical protein